MHMDRLFEIVYLLLEQRDSTASQLAEHFGVSTRTIYRDVETLSRAGVPIYANKGQHGGIHLTPDFVLEKTFPLSQQERHKILATLQGMHRAGEEIEPTLSKLAALFGGVGEDWIVVESTPGCPAYPDGSWFALLKQAILDCRLVRFLYSGSRGELTLRLVEPFKLIYKAGTWYLLAWCRLREDFRLFRVVQMREISLGEETFSHRVLPVGPVQRDPAHWVQNGSLAVEALVRRELAWRVYEEIPPNQREELPDGGFRVTFYLEEGEWAYDYLAGFGPALTILSPESVRRTFLRRCRSILKNYEGKAT